jgi:hypothetical protein
MQLIGTQILYFNRRVSRAEIAKRVALYEPRDISRICYEWFFDAVRLFKKRNQV